MTIGEASKSKLSDDTEYGYAFEEAESQGCSLTVSIADWALSRNFEAVLSTADAESEATRMAKALMVTIQGAN